MRNRKMDIGKLDKRITFCKYGECENELLQTEQGMEAIKTVWARIEPTRGREYQEAQRVRPELTYKITTRYHENITQDMVIQYREKYFQIISVINAGEKNTELEIICIEKGKEELGIKDKTEGGEESRKWI